MCPKFAGDKMTEMQIKNNAFVFRKDVTAELASRADKFFVWRHANSKPKADDVVELLKARVKYLLEEAKTANSANKLAIAKNRKERALSCLLDAVDVHIGAWGAQGLILYSMHKQIAELQEEFGQKEKAMFSFMAAAIRAQQANCFAEAIKMYEKAESIARAFVPELQKSEINSFGKNYDEMAQLYTKNGYKFGSEEMANRAIYCKTEANNIRKIITNFTKTDAEEIKPNWETRTSSDWPAGVPEGS